MACRRDQRSISRYLDGQLKKDEEKAVLEHIDACPECREFYEHADRISNRVRALEKTLPPPNLYARIRHKIASRESEPALVKWLRPVLVPALAVLTFILFGIASAAFFHGRRAVAEAAGTRADLNLQVFGDAPQSSMAQAYAQMTGERR